MKLTPKEQQNLLDALHEWYDTVGPKELQENETGLNAERFTAIITKLTNQQTPTSPKETS